MSELQDEEELVSDPLWLWMCEGCLDLCGLLVPVFLGAGLPTLHQAGLPLLPRGLPVLLWAGLPLPPRARLPVLPRGLPLLLRAALPVPLWARLPVRPASILGFELPPLGWLLFFQVFQSPLGSSAFASFSLPLSCSLGDISRSILRRSCSSLSSSRVVDRFLMSCLGYGVSHSSSRSLLHRSFMFFEGLNILTPPGAFRP